MATGKAAAFTQWPDIQIYQESELLAAKAASFQDNSLGRYPFFFDASLDTASRAFGSASLTIASTSTIWLSS